MKNIKNQTKLSSKLRNHPVAKECALHELMMIIANDICRKLHKKTDSKQNLKHESDQMIVEDNQSCLNSGKELDP